jgi:hypothetical protein
VCPPWLKMLLPHQIMGALTLDSMSYAVHEFPELMRSVYASDVRMIAGVITHLSLQSESSTKL